MTIRLIAVCDCGGELVRTREVSKKKLFVCSACGTLYAESPTLVSLGHKVPVGFRARWRAEHLDKKPEAPRRNAKDATDLGVCTMPSSDQEDKGDATSKAGDA